MAQNFTQFDPAVQCSYTAFQKTFTPHWRSPAAEVCIIYFNSQTYTYVVLERTEQLNPNSDCLKFCSRPFRDMSVLPNLEKKLHILTSTNDQLLLWSWQKIEFGNCTNSFHKSYARVPWGCSKLVCYCNEVYWLLSLWVTCPKQKFQMYYEILWTSLPAYLPPFQQDLIANDSFEFYFCRVFQMLDIALLQIYFTSLSHFHSFTTKNLWKWRSIPSPTMI